MVGCFADFRVIIWKRNRKPFPEVENGSPHKKFEAQKDVADNNSQHMYLLSYSGNVVSFSILVKFRRGE